MPGTAPEAASLEPARAARRRRDRPGCAGVAGLVLAALGACAAPPPASTATPANRPATEAAAARSIRALLAENLPTGSTRRARLARFDRVFLVDGAPEVAGRDARGPLDRSEHVVVDEGGDRIRLRVEDEVARVLVWVEREQLRPAVGRDLDAGGHDRTIASGAAIHLRAGALVARLGGHGPAGVQVRIDDLWLVAHASVPADALGETWRAAPADDEPAARPRAPGAVSGGATVRDRPSPLGQVLGTVERRLAVTSHAPAVTPGWHLVTLETQYVTLTGYVLDRDWMPGGSLVVSSSIEVVRGPGVTLDAGTHLHAGVEGPVVGVLLVPQTDGELVRPGWARWIWPSPWGPIELWGRCARCRLALRPPPPRPRGRGRSSSDRGGWARRGRGRDARGTRGAGSRRRPGARGARCGPGSR